MHETEHFRAAEAAGNLITIPTGDGMALVFYDTPEAPVAMCVEVSNALKEHPELKVRMGIHSGPVSGVVDVNDRSNVAGAGINMAQRVMDCGDAGHILLSKHVAEDLEQYRQWQPHLHDLGRMRSEARRACPRRKSLHRRPRQSGTAGEIPAASDASSARDCRIRSKASSTIMVEDRRADLVAALPR